MSELSLDEIMAIQATPEPAKKATTRKVSSDNRDIQTWLKLAHHMTEGTNCTVPNHELAVEAIKHIYPEGRARNKGATVKIGDNYVCRICFIASADLT